MENPFILDIRAKLKEKIISRRKLDTEINELKNKLAENLINFNLLAEIGVKLKGTDAEKNTNCNVVSGYEKQTQVSVQVKDCVLSLYKR